MEAISGKVQIASATPRKALEDWKASNLDKSVTDYHIQSGGVDIEWSRSSKG